MCIRDRLEHLPKREYIKEIITLETVINDITIILGAVLIINLMLAADAGPSIVSSLFTQVSVGIFAGIIGSLIWKPVITNTIKRHLYSFTIGFAFVMYYLIEVLGGSPIIGILVFAIMIGNMPALFRLRNEKRNEFNELLKSVKDTQGDITFITKSFFFVVLGIVFSPASLSNSAVLLVVGAILAAVFASRYITASIISRIDKEIRKEKLLISGMMARGFVATVAAFLPTKYGIVIPNMTDIILLLVFGATLASIFVVSYCLRGERAADLQSA